jgi:hypothetical protein
MIMYHSTGSKWAKAAAVIIHTIFSIFALLPQLDLMISETPRMGHGDLVIDLFFMPIWSVNILLAMLAAILPVYFQTRQGARLRRTNNPPALTYTGLFSDVCLILQVAMSWNFCTSWPWRIERISQVQAAAAAASYSPTRWFKVVRWEDWHIVAYLGFALGQCVVFCLPLWTRYRRGPQKLPLFKQGLA